MPAKWWHRQATVVALLAALLVVRAQTGALDLKDVSTREAAALYLLLYVGAFWVGLTVRWLDGQRYSPGKAE